MRTIIIAICILLANKAYAAGDCDLLGSLEADPLSISAMAVTALNIISIKKEVAS